MFNAQVHAACLAAPVKARCGYVPDKTFGARADVRSLSLVATDAPASKVQYDGNPFNQNRCASCGGHGTAKAKRQAYLSAGYAWPFAGQFQDFSPKWYYALARRLSTPATSASGPPLTDSGIDPSTLIAVESFGDVAIGTDAQCPAPDGSYSDCYPANVNDDVQLDAEIEGRVQVDFTAYDVDVSSANADTIASLVTPVLQTPAFGVAYGIFCDSAFEAYDPANGPLDGAANLNDSQGGGHWIDADEITMTYVAGKRCWGLLNSWSATFGLNGRIYVTDTRLVSMISQAIAFKANAPAVAWAARAVA